MVILISFSVPAKQILVPSLAGFSPSVAAGWHLWFGNVSSRRGNGLGFWLRRSHRLPGSTGMTPLRPESGTSKSEVRENARMCGCECELPDFLLVVGKLMIQIERAGIIQSILFHKCQYLLNLTHWNFKWV